VKKKFSVLGVETNHIGWQHIDGEIRRELRNVFAVKLRKICCVIACHEVAIHTLLKLPTAAARHIIRVTKLCHLARALAI
jgi:hypothetical protein